MVVNKLFISKEIFMGDKYNVTGQVGAVGSNAKAENNTFDQAWQQAAAGIDMLALASELTALRVSMRQQATEIEHDQATACVGAAESAAKKQNVTGALGHLKTAGTWAFEVATKIGTSIAAKAIQTAIGL
jgi:hypothetical protein